MHQWLSTVRSTPGHFRVLEVNKKLVVINGMGEHSRAQGSSAVKEAIGVDHTLVLPPSYAADVLWCRITLRLLRKWHDCLWVYFGRDPESLPIWLPPQSEAACDSIVLFAEVVRKVPFLCRSAFKLLSPT